MTPVLGQSQDGTSTWAQNTHEDGSCPLPSLIIVLLHVPQASFKLTMKPSLGWFKLLILLVFTSLVLEL